MKISTRLSLIMSTMALAIAISLSVAVYYVQSRELEVSSRHDMARMGNRIFQMINMFLYERAGDIKAIATSTKLMDDSYSMAQATDRLLEYRDFYKCYDSLALFDINRICLTDTTGLNIGAQQSLDRFWLDPLIGKELVVNVSYSPTIHESTIYFAYPVKNSAGNLFRIVISRIPSNKLRDIIRMQDEFDFEKYTEVDLVDKSGKIIFSSSRGDIINGRPHYWNSVRRGLREVRHPGPFYLTETMKGRDNGLSNLVYVLPEPSYLDAKSNEWILLMHLPLARAMAPVYALKKQLITITVSFVLLTLVIALFISRTISLPIIKLREATDLYAQGDLKLRVSVKGGDEIGSLSASFNNMADEIMKAHQEIESYSQSLELVVARRTKELKEKVFDLENTRRDLQNTLKVLKMTQAQLVESGKLAGIGQMAAGVAHEINNPLTSIMGFAQLTISRKDIDDTLRSDLRLIEKEAKRCVVIIENLLNFARPQEPQKVDVNISRLVDVTLKVVEYSMSREQVKIVTKLSEGLPLIKGDPSQLQQVFMNIILNAAHAMPKGGTLTIEASARCAVSSEQCTVDNARKKALDTEHCALNTGYVHVSFTDTGTGIPDDIKDKIFEPFFTTSYEAGYKGTGLGLSISRSIIETHHGSIVAKSVAGKGSVFTVILPISV